MTPVKYLPKQMNGPVLAAEGHALEDRLSDAQAIETYLYNLSIDTAQETELENIGRIIGYLRPLVPEGFNAENIFLFGTEPVIQDIEIGFASVNDSRGGQLSSVVVEETNFMGIGTYRKFLKAMAILKRYGITLKSIDFIAATLSNSYTIEHIANGDILLTFTENIGFKNLWVLTQLFYRIATDPQVIIIAGEGD